MSYLDKLTREQRMYVTYLFQQKNTRLIACAGSGKTRCIISRIKFMVEHGIAKRENIFAITFSRHAASDFHKKTRDLFSDYEDFCCLKNFSTIDSLAKSILCKFKCHKSENVEILSIALRNLLASMTRVEDVIALRSNKDIHHLFVDEAQDLNEVQYDILMQFQRLLGTRIHLVGDPNQNIYQFRRSSSSYLLGFKGVEFALTLNFRSTRQIIAFNESIKPIQRYISRSATGRDGSRVTIITQSMTETHKLILRFIDLYSKKRDLSDIAIICPTRGIGAKDDIGLSVFFNLFKMNNIPFCQLYDESGQDKDKKRACQKIPGHINLLTYHGTKGLEFDVVFVMDFYQFLFNIKPSLEEHQINRYLLYVATSRAISMMFVCTYTESFGGYLNHWISYVPPNVYETVGNVKTPLLTLREEPQISCINSVTEIIGELSDQQLNIIYDILSKNINQVADRRIYPSFINIDRGNDEVLFGIFCEELFGLQYCLINHVPNRKMLLIELIINFHFVIVKDQQECKNLKKYTKELTWTVYDKTKNGMPNDICQMIEKYFPREREIRENILCTSEFKKIINENIENIKESYENYLNPEKYNYDYQDILEDFFYLIVVKYGYENNHYYYINNNGIDKKNLLINGLNLYKEMDKYLRNNYLSCDLVFKKKVSYSKLSILGEIDFLENRKDDETIVEVKCCSKLSIKHYLQVLIYGFCRYHRKNPSKIYQNKYKILNLLTGVEHYLIIKISPADMFNVLIIMAEVGNLVFNDVVLVYDLETTDMIRVVGPLDAINENISRCARWKMRGGKYYGQILPEIIDIAIRDYDTGMILVDSLVKPNCETIPLEIQNLTGISPSMLVDKCNLDVIKKILQRKMARFASYKMIAHNGACFDQHIVLYDEIVDPKRVTFIDSMSLIPIHMPNNSKLKKKSLVAIYEQLFQKTFIAHRAMNDVSALIEIMKYLNICFDNGK